MKKKKIRALVLISGGLDSRLAVKLLQNQGIEIIGLNFDFPFGSACCDTLCTFSFSQKNKFKLEIINCKKGKLFKEYLNIVKNPKFGYGSAMNPCIDCRIFILKKAKKLMKKYKADFIATGEVLNERPMSQHLESLKLVEKESGLEGKLLRPLSAKLLPETEAEKKGLINRSKLLNIKGRSRKIQLELAKKFGISYPTPGGGCLLCEKEFAKKLRDALNHDEIKNYKDTELLKIGRHFRLKETKIIIGRNQKENEMLSQLGKNWIKMECKDIVGPLTLIKNENKEALKIAAELTAHYADSEKLNKLKILYGKNYKKLHKELETKKINPELIQKYRI